MHQKYLIHAETATVVTGTANMSTDATSRHSEHRIQIGGCRKLAEQFNADFDTIWGRLSAHSASSQRKEERSEPLSSNSEAS
jgi:phosphatidylserine/phosphatidylglycerophosphate/cardiolipin synthase-like enzyme